MEHLTLLNGLMMSGCLNIRSLPTLPRSVAMFQVDDYDDEIMNSSQTFGDPNWEYIFDPARKENKILSCTEHACTALCCLCCYELPDVVTDL